MNPIPAAIEKERCLKTNSFYVFSPQDFTQMQSQSLLTISDKISFLV